METVIANSRTHLELENRGYVTCYVRNGVATLARPGDDPQEALAEAQDAERCELDDFDDYRE